MTCTRDAVKDCSYYMHAQRQVCCNDEFCMQRQVHPEHLKL